VAIQADTFIAPQRSIAGVGKIVNSFIIDFVEATFHISYGANPNNWREP
jgi:hypothetical protein